MATVVVMPQLGNSVESCLIVSWQVAVGDEIAENAIVCEVETDKASMEVPSSAAGTVLAILWDEGDDVPVKEPPRRRRRGRGPGRARRRRLEGKDGGDPRRAAAEVLRAGPRAASEPRPPAPPARALAGRCQPLDIARSRRAPAPAAG